MHPRAIETRYKGYRFRSRLEARWAVFFDALGLKWDYEPEGFELPSGRYLPDFRVVSDRGVVWFEVKPATGGDDSKPRAFAQHNVGRICVLNGAPELRSYPVYQCDQGGEVEGTDALVFVPPDSKYSPYFFACGTFRLGDIPGWFDAPQTRRVREAVDTARGARFEFGEKGGR